MIDHQPKNREFHHPKSLHLLAIAATKYYQCGKNFHIIECICHRKWLKRIGLITQPQEQPRVLSSTVANTSNPGIDIAPIDVMGITPNYSGEVQLLIKGEVNTIEEILYLIYKVEGFQTFKCISLFSFLAWISHKLHWKGEIILYS